MSGRVVIGVQSLEERYRGLETRVAELEGEPHSHDDVGDALVWSYFGDRDSLAAGRWISRVRVCGEEIEKLKKDLAPAASELAGKVEQLKGRLGDLDTGIREVGTMLVIGPVLICCGWTVIAFGCIMTGVWKVA